MSTRFDSVSVAANQTVVYGGDVVLLGLTDNVYHDALSPAVLMVKEAADWLVQQGSEQD